VREIERERLGEMRGERSEELHRALLAIDLNATDCPTTLSITYPLPLYFHPIALIPFTVVGGGYIHPRLYDQSIPLPQLIHANDLGNVPRCSSPSSFEQTFRNTICTYFTYIHNFYIVF
jgi:hypothetical protein